MTEEDKNDRPSCPDHPDAVMVKKGRTPAGVQRWQCKICGKRISGNKVGRPESGFDRLEQWRRYQRKRRQKKPKE